MKSIWILVMLSKSVSISNSSLESWLNAICKQTELRNKALIEFLTKEPEMDIVLDFRSHEKLEVVINPSGSVRLYKVWLPISHMIES